MLYDIALITNIILIALFICMVSMVFSAIIFYLIWDYTSYRPCKWLIHDVLGYHEPSKKCNHFNSVCKHCNREIELKDNGRYKLK